ncbi:MAG: ABC transporter permease [Steroidobacteraceae bacterium]
MNTLRRIRLVAGREFLVTVSSKGFLFGVLIMPVIMGVLLSVIPKLLNQSGVAMQVEVGLIDRSSLLAQPLREELQPAAITARREASRREAAERTAPGAGDVRNPLPVPILPSFTIKSLPADANLDPHKTWLKDANIGKTNRRALVVVPVDAVTRAQGQETYAKYEVYAPRNLPQDAEGILHNALRQVLITERLRGSGFDPAIVKAATTNPSTATQLVTAGGRQGAAQGLNRALPFIMGILLFMGVMIGGQSMMTSTVEEKSSRVVEVLLAAASPLELMWGKLLGQLGVGLVSMGVYVILGLLALLQFSMVGLIDPMLIVWLVVFFLISYLMYGALMLSIGAAVNQIADAQSLMGPVMVLLIVPYALSPIIGRAPDSAIAVAASFIPPVNAFAMLARIASSSPPPLWQVLLSVLAGVAGSWVAVWFAAKIFRIGLLMHGKPPGFGTLIKWARMS